VTPKQLAALKAHRESRDPLLIYQARPTSLRFHESSARHKLLTGGNRSSKTTTGLVDLAMKLRGIHPHHKWTKPLRVWIWCQSRSQAAAVVGRKLFEKSELIGPCEQYPMIPPWEIAELGKIKLGGINVYQRCLLKNGSEALFGWAGVEKSWARYQGLQLDGVVVDESAAEGDILNETLMRLTDARAAYSETEPWRGFFYWFASGTQVSENFEIFKANCLRADLPDWQIFQIPASERPPELQEQMANVALTLTEEQRRIRIEGDSTATEELLIFKRQWSDDRHMRATDYIVKPDDCLWCVIDPGVDHPSGIAFAAINKENPLKLRFVKFFLQKRLTAEEEVQIIKDYLCGRRLDGMVYDPAAHRTEKSGLSIKNQWVQLLAKNGVQIVRGLIQGRNRHSDTINKVRSYLDPDPLNPYAEPMLEFNPSPESGCPIIRSQMLAYRSYEAGKYTGARGVVKKSDEGVDVVRYLCSITPAYNPAATCGHPTIVMPEPGPDVSVEEMRYRAHLAASRDMVRNLQSRDTGPGAINLW
jgi:hypothetical protein